MSATLRARAISLGIAVLLCLAATGCSDDVLRLGARQESVAVGTVNSLLLREAATSVLISDLLTATPISIAALPSPEVSLEAAVSGHVGSVAFVVDDASSVEVVVPFTFPGDTDGKLTGFSATIGPHMAKATPYFEEGALGQRGAPLSLPFTFIE